MLNRNQISTLAVAVAVLFSSSAVASIDLEWRPLAQTVNVGDPVGIELYAVSDSSESQWFSSTQVIIGWDPAYLELTGNDITGALPLFSSSFLPGDSFGINEADPPADGDGMWVGLAPFGQELAATPEGSLLTTITFNALAETPGTWVTKLEDAQYPPLPPGYTRMLNLQGDDVLGALGAPALVTIVPEPSTLLLGVLSVAVVLRQRSR
jgi:hypothetical protein